MEVPSAEVDFGGILRGTRRGRTYGTDGRCRSLRQNKGISFYTEHLALLSIDNIVRPRKSVRLK